MGDILDSLEDVDSEEGVLDTGVDDADVDFSDSESLKNDYLEGVVSSSDVEQVNDLSHDFSYDPDAVFSEDKAREVTEAIKYASIATYALLYEAYQHKAHKALGYQSWAAYVKEEFDISKSRSYQIIAQAEAIKSIEDISPEGTEIKLTEAQVRDLKSELPRITQVIQSSTQDMSADDAEDFINDLIQREREQNQDDRKAIEAKRRAEQEKEQEEYFNSLENDADALLGGPMDGPEGDNSLSGGGGGSYSSPGGVVVSPDSPHEFGDNADSGLFEHEVEGSADSLSSENSINIHNFFVMLSSLTSLPEPEYLIDLIPSSRKDDIENQLTEATSWLNRFHTLWSDR